MQFHTVIKWIVKKSVLVSYKVEKAKPSIKNFIPENLSQYTDSYSKESNALQLYSQRYFYHLKWFYVNCSKEQKALSVSDFTLIAYPQAPDNMFQEIWNT